MTTNAIQCEILMTNLLTHFIMPLKQIIARRLYVAWIVRTMAQIGIESELRSLPHNMQDDSVTNYLFQRVLPTSYKLLKLLDRKHWVNEYLINNNFSSKWNNYSRQLETAATLWLKYVNSHWLQWPLARISTISPGRDNTVSIVELKTAVLVQLVRKMY